MNIKQRSKIQKAILLSLSLLGASSALAAIPDSITLKSTTDIKVTSAGLSEPSGLALSYGKNALWTVSDDTSKIFKMELDGDFKASKTISIDGLSDQEGIALGLNGVYLYTVSEDLNAINQVDIDNSTLVTAVGLAQMIGFAQMDSAFPYHFDAARGGNKGLEGITIHPNNGNFLLLKESGLLVEVSSDLTTIVNYWDLSFADDYSGICFEDIDRNRVWILSDDSKRIYLFDTDTAQVKESFKLRKSDGSTFDSAEGVAYDIDERELYIVTDNTQKLRKFNVKY